MAVDQNFTAGGLVEAVDNVHQRRLARTILAQQGQNLAALQRQVDVLIRHHTGKTLGNIAGFEDGDWRVGHAICSVWLRLLRGSDCKI